MGINLSDYGRISQNFGNKNSGYELGYHTGVDVVLNNDRVGSFTSGTVAQIKDSGNKGFGKHVVVKDDNGNYILYGHLSSIANLKVGQKVTPYMRLGTQGNTGNSHGKHLHVEVRQGANQQSKSIDAAAYLKQYGQKSGFEAFGNTGKGARAKNLPDKTITQTIANGPLGDFWGWLTSGGWVHILVRIVLVLLAIMLLYTTLKKGLLE